MTLTSIIQAKTATELRKAGAPQVVIGSDSRWAKIVDHAPVGDPQLTDLLAALSLEMTGIILVEGFRHVAFPKIEIQRGGSARPQMCGTDPDIVAIVTDRPHECEAALPTFGHDDLTAITDFIERYHATAITT